MNRSVSARSVTLIAVGVLAGALAGCSKAPDDGGPSETRGREGAEVRVSRTPGVAMSYGYRFLIAAAKVQALQERHASACEALGPARCRVVGMGYHVYDQRRIDATLSLKLAPDLARRFGRQGVVAATEMGGMLTDATALGEEAGVALAAARTEMAEKGREGARALSDVTRSGNANERTALREQAAAAAAAEQARAARDAATLASARLASTPVEFGYLSGAVDTGFADGPMLGAIKDGWANIVSGTATLTMIAITILPWLLAAFLAALFWRRLLRPLLARALGNAPAE